MKQKQSPGGRIPVMSRNLPLFFSTFSLLLFSAAQHFLFAQARLVLGNTSAAYMAMNGGTAVTPIYLVVGNSGTAAAPNTITRNSTAGIISEGQYNYVKWYIGNGTGTGYLLPWRDNTAPATEDASVKFDITTGGTAGGFFLASTYDGVTDNLTYMPAPVTNMTSGALTNASQFVIDRFWSLIDEASYPTKPALNNLTFTYIDNEHSANMGPITEANLRTQRWNTPLASNNWEGLLFGTAPNTVANTQATAALSSADLFRWWTLVDNTSPLPVELLSFTAQRDGAEMRVRCDWTTATEINNDYFAIERSQNGINFSQIGTVQGAGNSSTTQNYTFYDNEPYYGLSYYRLRQVDYDGTFSYSNIEPVYIGNLEIINIYPSFSDDEITIIIYTEQNTDATAEVFDALGQKVYTKEVSLQKGKTEIKVPVKYFASGQYVFRVTLPSGEKKQKVFMN